MASIKSLFEKKISQSKTPKSASEIIKELFPIRNLSQEILDSFDAESHVESLAAGARLFEIGHSSDCAIYLLGGTVKLTDLNGKSFEIEAGNAQAKFPLCSSIKHTTTATAKTDITILRVSLNIMTTKSRSEPSILEIAEELSSNRLLTLFANHFHEHDLEFPTLPEVAINLQKAIEKDVSISEAVKIIQLDPAISAKILEIANCPLYLTNFPASNCQDAVNRIGLQATRSLVTSLSLKKLFRTKSPLLKNYLETQWKQSINLSVLCHTLAASSQQQNPEDALLAGLICDIGLLPFLSFVANLPSEYINDAEIKQAIPILKGIVGAAVLKEWAFPPAFIDVALKSDDWFQNSSDELSLTDIVVLSRLHALIGKKSSNDLPAITAIPASSKLKNMALSPENSLEILHNSKAKIQSAISILSH
jgi:HD-like signal output (HDOD) protein